MLKIFSHPQHFYRNQQDVAYSGEKKKSLEIKLATNYKYGFKDVLAQIISDISKIGTNPNVLEKAKWNFQHL